MHEDEMRRIREQQERLEVWQHERRQELRQEVLSQAERDEALSVARRTTLIGVLPSVVWYFVRLLQQGMEGAFALVFSGFFILALFLLFSLAMASVSGLFAHWWFHGSTIPVRRMAFALALLSDAVLFGWVLVLTS